MKRSLLWSAAGVIAANLYSPAMMAYAQDVEAGVTAENTKTLSTVVVTAQKKAERLIDVPMAIKAIGGEELEKLGVTDIQELSFAVPGLTMREDGPGSYTVFLRGLANQSGSGALVGMYMDEMPLTLGGYDQLAPVALDFERVEVLKGPQGTLYGVGAAGGVVRFITNDPNLNKVEGSIGGEVYSVSDGEMGYTGELVLNVPLIENKLAFRLAAAYEDGGGWIDQPEAGIEDGNGTELTNIRAKLLWVPTDDFSAKVTVQTHRASTELGMGYEEADRTVDVGPDRSKVMIPKEFDFDIYNLEMSYDFGFAELTSSTTQVEHDHQYPFSYIPREGNYSYGFVEGNDDRFVEASRFSQEIRLSDTEGMVEWTVGAFYSDLERSLIADYEYLYAVNGDLNEGGGVLYDDLYYGSAATAESVSIFADVELNLTDKFAVGVGARYFEEDQTSLIEYAPGTGVAESATFDSFDPRVYMTYKYADEKTLYASIGKGFRSGGFNAAPFDPYDPEEVYTYEIGTKGAAADGKIQFDIATFFTQYQDMIRRRLVLVDGQLLGESSNIGEVEIFGVEGGIAVKPIEPLTISLNAAYLNSEIVATDATDQVNNVGDATDYTPELSATIGINYDFNLAPDIPGFARIDYNYRDEVTYIDRSSFFESVLPQASDSLSLLNARVGVTLNAFDLEIFATNLTDENVSIDPYQGWANANRTQPRVIGLKAKYNF
ncbi:TonB-dependent receptor [Hirschia baltica]|uniref:TonB-dependent receptor n=1 Tax=Hirschia baltica (strain ATCC 49814 / DSM 5838 / IFAM 1418) TaxID=582402 RepID=C6XP07_HIRBI|nr:TonB-dependent receptor [Hirschia baltica]ACT60187.1 TonB-dependent receptor [Hirschia baltica ATCC 49814]